MVPNIGVRALFGSLRTLNYGISMVDGARLGGLQVVPKYGCQRAVRINFKKSKELNRIRYLLSRRSLPRDLDLDLDLLGDLDLDLEGDLLLS